MTGKPAGNDLRERKRSIPVAVALGSGTRAGEMLADLDATKHLDDADIGRAEPPPRRRRESAWIALPMPSPRSTSIPEPPRSCWTWQDSSWIGSSDLVEVPGGSATETDPESRAGPHPAFQKLGNADGT